ncbi:hypothetical protein PTHTG4_09930 [Parageobacillus thermoglucosidasius]|uniref:hypothetical protein n=1 Tax=Parageobacillus thermoglucosidasius TaxID=1426 RepID=UPI000F623D60|nr:hypothetical protein [Parageobacillus thermoglucosidasius]GCD81931.1 hypothetical protein PTHTG4_09930 [Parageobacillus thermoglucosidasius]
MAFDLKAVLRLDDKFSSPMRRMQRATEQMKRVTEQTRRVTDSLANSQARIATQSQRAGFSMRRLSDGLKSARAGISGLTGVFTGLAAAIGGAYAAQKLFNATVGEAAKYERSQGLITAMMGNPTKAKKFMEEINKMAINSPLLNSADMMSAASAFLPMTKDLNRLKKLYDLSERLYVLNDREGIEGASFALREFLMGRDATSLVERFNLNRKVLNDLKNLSFDKAVKGLDELLNKMGITRQTINHIGNDTLAKWNQIKERMQVMLRSMGGSSLKVLNNFLTNLINKLDAGDMTRFANVGARIIQNILTGMTNTATRIYDWFSNISKSPEFQQRTTLWGKVKFIISNLYQQFLEWLKNDGVKQIASATSDLIIALSSALQNNAGPIAEAALKVGAKIGAAFGRGILDAVSKNPIAQFLIGGTGPVVGTVYSLVDKFLSGSKKSKKRSVSSNSSGMRAVKGYAGGLNYVPYDRFPALLHRGEMVLPRGEADEYRKGRASGVSVTISGNTFHVRQDSDIQKIAYELAKLLERKGASMANVR